MQHLCGLPVPTPAVSSVGEVEKIPHPDSDSAVELNFDEAMEALGEDGFNAVANALDMFRRK